MTTFQIDHRHNPALHRLYVSYAIEELTLMNEFIEAMTDFSRVTASMIAGDMVARRTELILQDAAFFDAVAFMAAGKTARDFQDPPDTDD